MPIYEYQCEACGVFEVTQKISEEALKTCPKCKIKSVKRLVSATAFQLKGSGWYKTDYASKPKTTSEKTETKTETKQVIKPEVKK